MKPGSVIVDLAGEAGGNCELTEPGETVVRHDVKIVSPLNLPASMPEHSSQLFARNVLALLELLVGEDGALNLDFDDEIVKGACVVRDGEIVNPGRQGDRGGRGMILASTLTTNLAILVLAGFIGFVVISKVPEHAAHAADVGHQRDPRDRPARRPADRRPVRATAPSTRSSS